MRIHGAPCASWGVTGVPFLKVCGITRSEDAAAAARLGYDAVGMVFAQSPRRVSPDTARQICAALPPGIMRVGVFVDEEAGEVRRIADYCGLDLVQFHGGEDPGEVASFGARAIVALRPRRLEDLDALGDYPGVFAFLIDTWDPHLAGGTGVAGDWELAARAARMARVVLAGGLNPRNVAQAAARVRPFGMDASSGLESEPGIKDHVLMREFSRVAKAALPALKDEENKYVETRDH
jgi:phosphoribosylanthranilate isomerase